MASIRNVSIMFARWLAAAAVVALLSACAAPQIETSVQAYSTLDAQPAQEADRVYRFERLPSQQADAALQDELEQSARVALQAAGLSLAGSPSAPTAASPRLSVQVSLQQTPVYLGHYAPDIFWGWGWGWGWGGWGPPYYSHWASPYWDSGHTEVRSELTLLMRNLGSGQIVFESRALHSDQDVPRSVLVPALLKAALLDFPLPPSGPRRIVIPLPARQ